MKESNTRIYHWYCHLRSIARKKGDEVNRASIIGIMGATGNVTGTHLHYEIRNKSNKYGDDQNPATYMGIPNKVGLYESNNYQITEMPDISYEVHVQNIGWQEQKENGELAGTEGQSLRIEAIKIHADIPIQYRVHIQDKGWTEFVTNSCEAGTTGESKRIEAIEIISSKNPIRATAHIEGIGNVYYEENTHLIIGTEGRALRLEALRLQFI